MAEKKQQPTAGALRAAERIVPSPGDPLHRAEYVREAAQIIDQETAAPELLEACEEMAKRECEYPGSAGCDMLPEGIVRRVCLPCKARAAITKERGQK